MMFTLGEHIVYNSRYICVVDAICEEGSPCVPHYVLRPVHERNTVIKIPVDTTKVEMRALISRDRAVAVISEMSGIVPRWIEDKALRTQEHRRALHSGDCLEWAQLAANLAYRKTEVAKNGKRLSSTDEQTLKTAEKLLHGELSITLGLSAEELQARIAARRSASAAR